MLKLYLGKYENGKYTVLSKTHNEYLEDSQRDNLV